MLVGECFLGVFEDSARRFLENPALQALPPIVTTSRVKHETQTCKVLQSDHSIVVVVQHIQSGRYQMTTFPLASPLQFADSCTSDVIVAFLREQLNVPLLEAVRARFPYNWDVGVTDRGSANLKAESQMQHGDPSANRLTIPCNLHIGFNSQGRQFDPVKEVVSCMIAFALSQRPGGALSKFRAELSSVLVSMVTIVESRPPSSEDPRIVHRDAIFALFLGECNLPTQKRRASLELLFNGNLDDDAIVWHTGGQVVLSVDEWAEEAVGALFPHATPLFPRHRWLRSHSTINEIGLLGCCHGLLQKVVPRWLSALAGKVPRPLLPDGAPGGAVFEDDGDDHAAGDAFAPQHPGAYVNPADGNIDWVAYNAAQRGTASSLPTLAPPSKLIVIRIVVGPQVRVCRSEGLPTPPFTNSLRV